MKRNMILVRDRILTDAIKKILRRDHHLEMLNENIKLYFTE